VQGEALLFRASNASLVAWAFVGSLLSANTTTGFSLVNPGANLKRIHAHIVLHLNYSLTIISRLVDFDLTVERALCDVP
jgi:hypothetical protein